MLSFINVAMVYHHSNRILAKTQSQIPTKQFFAPSTGKFQRAHVSPSLFCSFWSRVVPHHGSNTSIPKATFFMEPSLQWLGGKKKHRPRGPSCSDDRGSGLGGPISPRGRVSFQLVLLLKMSWGQWSQEASAVEHSFTLCEYMSL